MTDREKGLTAFREGRMREAADRLQAASDEHELTVTQAAQYEASAFLGAALYALGLPAQAMTAFENAVRFAPGGTPPPDLLMNFAHASLAAGQRGSARETLRSLLDAAPGHVAAGMLLARLEAASGAAVSGAVLGTSVKTAQDYIRTLTFTRNVPHGYDPAEVQEALSQLGRYIGGLTRQLEDAQAQIAERDSEIQRYRQMEDAVVESMMQQSPHAEHDGSAASENGLSPIELLFRQKT